ncbi:MAG: hypothetical protein M0Z60_03345 [Nitrospiraceae bacterium]|nr:hypothetical protein [Nitrospiraceae bacterium]
MNIKVVFFIALLFVAALPFYAFAQPAPTGACCAPAGGCTLATSEASCETGTLNIFQGLGTVCDPNPCPQPPVAPAMNEWGMLVFIGLAGIGAVYFLRRQRREER